MATVDRGSQAWRDNLARMALVHAYTIRDEKKQANGRDVTQHECGLCPNGTTEELCEACWRAIAALARSGK